MKALKATLIGLGLVRPGQRHPYLKGSQREIDERRGAVARLLARGARKMEIHRFIKGKFNRQWRTADRDIACLTWLAHAHAGKHA